MSNTQRISLLEPLEPKVLIAGDDIEGRYVLKAKLGEGGMGVVFLAKQVSTNRDVALKVMKLDKVDETSVERFRQEIDIISGLSHPNIVRVFDTGRIPNRDLVYVVMELVEGISLNEIFWYKHQEQAYYKCMMDVGMALEIAYQVLAALTEPHMQGIIHRDIKPENLIIVPRSDETLHVKVLDFGVARVLSSKKRVTDTRIPFVGTPHYMAPEQVASSQYDARTDLYAIGVMLYELICGQYPFDDENLLALLLRKTQYDAPPLADRIVGERPPKEVLDLVHELLARDPDKRPSDAIEVRHRIDEIRDKHHFKRLRIPTRKLLSEPAPLANSEQAVERLQRLFAPWLMLPTGRPLDTYLADPTLSPTAPYNKPQPQAPPKPAADANPNAKTDETPQLPPALAARGSDELEEEDGVAPKAAKPVQHHMQAWHVAEGWTDSFDVSNLKRDFKDMEELFEGPAEDDDEDLEEAITTLYTSDRLESVLEGYSEMTFDDPPSFGDNYPYSVHHTPSPVISKRLQLNDDEDMDPTIKEIGSVGEILRQLQDEGEQLALEVKREESTNAAFAPLHDEHDDIVSSLVVPPESADQSMDKLKTVPEFSPPAFLLAARPPKAKEDQRSMADTVEVDPVVASAELDQRPEQAPFVPESFGSEGQDTQDADEAPSDEDIDAFADTMPAPAEDLEALGIIPATAPRRVETPSALGLSTAALSPQFGAISIDADEAQSLQLKAVEILAAQGEAISASQRLKPTNTEDDDLLEVSVPQTQPTSLRPQAPAEAQKKQLSTHYEAKIDLEDRPASPAKKPPVAMIAVGVVLLIALIAAIAVGMGG